MTKSAIWKIFSDAFVASFEPGTIYDQTAALSDGNLAGAMACYKAGLSAALEDCEKLRQGLVDEEGFDPGILSRMRFMLERRLEGRPEGAPK